MNSNASVVSGDAISISIFFPFFVSVIFASNESVMVIAYNGSRLVVNANANVVSSSPYLFCRALEDFDFDFYLSYYRMDPPFPAFLVEAYLV